MAQATERAARHADDDAGLIEVDRKAGGVAMQRDQVAFRHGALNHTPAGTLSVSRSRRQLVGALQRTTRTAVLFA